MAHMERRGLALIIVVGVLAVLASIATAFVMMAELERKASRQRMFSTKAYLLARSGIEDALARLAAGQDPDAPENRYQGEDWDALPGGLLSALEADQELFRPTGVGTPADIDACPLRHAMRPSFFVRPSAGSPDPALVNVDGRKRGYSGVLAGEDFSEGNAYALKVSSPSGFFVNGGDPASIPPVPGDYNDTLRRMLGTLAEALDRDPASADGGVDNGSPVSQADGEALINARPATGWASMDQIRTGALDGIQSKLDALQPYLTLKAWVDRKVIRPAPGSVAASPSCWGEIKLGHPIPGFESINGKVVGRAPVAFAWAKERKPAMIALLAGLKGWFLDEDSQRNAAWGVGEIGTWSSAEIANTWVDWDNCHVAAEALMAATITTWQDFNAACDAIAFGGDLDQQRAKQGILKANFNPNSDLNKFNPNRSLWRSVDKQDLSAYSTEFNFFPLSHRRIQCVGRIVSARNRLLSIRTLTTSLSSPSMARLTTQREFVCGKLGSLDYAGDETDPRKPGDADFLGTSRGESPTWGHTRMSEPDRGFGLQSHPEPCVATGGSGTALSINPADYDGNLQLATVETMTGQWYGVEAPTKQMMLLARFDDGFDLDVAASGNAANQPDTLQVSNAELSNSLLASAGAKPNTLYPDGGYTELARVPGYADLGNAHGFHGLMSFWVKNAMQWRKSATNSSNLRGHQYVQWTNYSTTKTKDPNPYSASQLYVLGFCRRSTADKDPVFASFFEIGHETDDIDMEFRFQTQSRSADVPRKWQLLTWYWDFQAATTADAGELLVNAGTGSSDKGSSNDYPTASPYSSIAPLFAKDITKADAFGSTHRIFLGRRQDRPWESNLEYFFGGAGDATIDEFAIYDFSAGATAVSDSVASTFASQRYSIGRYYKGAVYALPAEVSDNQAGSWVSAPIQLPSGSVLRKVIWSWYRPSEAVFANDYAEVELLKLDADSHLWSDGTLSRSTEGPGWTKDRQDWEVNRAVSGPFRARVVFRRGATPSENISMDGNTPLIDSPVFDDLSFVYLPPGGDSFLSWAEGE